MGDLLTAVCPECEGEIEYTAEYAGTEVYCPLCQSPLGLPELEKPTEETLRRPPPLPSVVSAASHRGRKYGGIVLLAALVCIPSLFVVLVLIARGSFSSIRHGVDASSGPLPALTLGEIHMRDRYPMFEESFWRINNTLEKETGFKLFTYCEYASNGIVNVTATDTWLILATEDEWGMMDTTYQLWQIAVGEGRSITLNIFDSEGKLLTNRGRSNNVEWMNSINYLRNNITNQ